jgi:hypothetical protein
MRIQDSVKLDIDYKRWQVAVHEITKTAERLTASGATDIRFDLDWIHEDYAVPALFFMRDETPDELVARVRVERREPTVVTSTWTDPLHFALSTVLI